MVETYTDDTLSAVGRKIQREITFVCSDKANSTLKGDKEHILNFLWDKIFADLKSHIPCLVEVVTVHQPNLAKNTALVLVWIAMMIKYCNDKLSLIQRILSIFYMGMEFIKRYEPTDRVLIISNQ